MPKKVLSRFNTRKKDSFRALSLFSGCGGMDIGIRKAGFNVAACIEVDRFACESLRWNNEIKKNSSKVIHADITRVDPQTLADDIQINKGGLSLLFAGPPCQSFSLAGKQLGLSDPRGPLLFEIIRFAKFFKPKVILLEQVKGLLSAKDSAGKKGRVFTSFLNQLEGAGYIPKWQIMLAADFGVSQLRERLFVVATLGHNGFLFPDRTHASIDECKNLFPLQPYKTVGSAINGIGKPEIKVKGQNVFNRTDSHVDVTPARDRERISQVPEGCYLAAQTHLGSELRRGLTSKDTTKYLRLHRKRPSNTLRCGEIFYHPTEDRYLTPREYMRIHGYPDDYELKGPIRSRTGTVNNLDQHRQVANSVPPPLAHVLGVSIKRYINE